MKRLEIRRKKRIDKVDMDVELKVKNLKHLMWQATRASPESKHLGGNNYELKVVKTYTSAEYNKLNVFLPDKFKKAENSVVSNTGKFGYKVLSHRSGEVKDKLLNAAGYKLFEAVVEVEFK